jgi:hypothetical protein
VPAARQSGLVHGTGPDSAKSTLQTPGPYRNLRSAERYLLGSRSPASRASVLGEVSSRTALAGGSSASERTQRPVSMRPPDASTASAIASVMRALPPVTTGQPTPCASTTSMSPMPAVGMAVSGIIACAAAPARIARASSVCQRLATAVAGRMARRP